MKFTKCMALAIVGAMTMTSMIGCGSSTSSGGSSSSKGKTLTVLTHRTDMDETFKTYAEEFEKTHEGVTVKFENLNDYQNTISTRMGTNDYGDVLMIPANITKNQYPDFFEPLGTYDELSQKYDYLSDVNVDGTIYGLATGANANGFVYNKEVFDKAGVTELPKTPEEYVNALKQIKEKCPDVIPYYTNYKDSWTLTNFSNGIETSMAGDTDYLNKMFYDKNEFLPGSVTYTSLKLLYDAVANQCVEQDPMTSDWEYSKQAMADGKIGVMCLGSWAIGQIKAKSQNPDNIKFMAAPSTVNGKQNIQVAADYRMGVNKNSENKEVAKDFVKFFVERYPQDSNMLSSLKGTELPDFLKTGGNVELIQQKAGTTEQAKDFDAVQKESLINLSDPTWIKTVIEIGLGNGKQSFDDYMKSLNESWVKGIDSIGK